MAFFQSIIHSIWSGVAWLFGAAKQATKHSQRRYQILHLVVLLIVALMAGFFTFEICIFFRVGPADSGLRIVDEYLCGWLVITLYAFGRSLFGLLEGTDQFGHAEQGMPKAGSMAETQSLAAPGPSDLSGAPASNHFDATSKSVARDTDPPLQEIPDTSRRESIGNADVGTTVGPYLLVRKLGQGGMGLVFEARHLKLERTFALKILPEAISKKSAALTRFDREVKTVGKLDHPNIVKPTDAGESNGVHFLVMELLEGTDLSQFVKRRGPLPVEFACQMIYEAALGLEHAHARGIIHRDIKPSNLFLTKDGQVKLLDLGLARLGSDGISREELTLSGQVLGTPDYMAPEQWDDTHSVDGRTDLYSMGCTLFFLLIGKAPFDDGGKPSVLRLMKAHTEGKIPDLTTHRSDVPPELNTIFCRLMAKTPDERFASMSQFSSELMPFVKSKENSSNPSFLNFAATSTVLTEEDASTSNADFDSAESGSSAATNLMINPTVKS